MSSTPPTWHKRMMCYEKHDYTLVTNYWLCTVLFGHVSDNGGLQKVSNIANLVHFYFLFIDGYIYGLPSILSCFWLGILECTNNKRHFLILAVSDLR